MKDYQAIGYTLLNTSAVTAIVSTRVSHGLRPDATLPAINYYQVGPGTRHYGVAEKTFSINCRASSASVARDLAETVVDLFGGTDGGGVHGTMNGFDIARASLRNDNGLIPEPDTDAYNAPVDILLTYSVGTVS